MVSKGKKVKKTNWQDSMFDKCFFNFYFQNFVFKNLNLFFFFFVGVFKIKNTFGYLKK